MGVVFKSERHQLIPEALLSRNRWLCWTSQPRGGKFMKAPVNPYTGDLASVLDRYAWSGFEQAKWARERFGSDGLGFVLNGDGIVAIDLDHCVSWDHDRFHINKQAEDIVRSLNSYTEFSPSRKGVHIWLFGCLPEARRRANRNIHEPAICDGHWRPNAWLR